VGSLDVIVESVQRLQRREKVRVEMKMKNRLGHLKVPEFIAVSIVESTVPLPFSYDHSNNSPLNSWAVFTSSMQASSTDKL
jgi:hypothetical protein